MFRYYKIDHKALFIFGYFFYLFTPYLAGTFEGFRDYPGILLYQTFFKQIPANKIQSYLLITLSWLPAFFLGHFCARLVWPVKRSLQLFSRTPLSLSVAYIAILLSFFLLLFGYLGRHSLFNAYGTYDVMARGKISTLMVIYNFFLVYQLLTKQKPSFFLIAGTIITGLLLLSMGGRMYVTQTFIMYVVFKTSFSGNPWPVHKLVLFVLFAFVVSSFVGVWRQGASFNLNYSLYSLLAEPMFTWFSTSTFLINNDIPFINFPTNFFTSFINLIPNTFGNARQYVVSAQEMGYMYESPLGADSVWTNFVINFGAGGSFIFVCATGFILCALRHFSERNRFCAVYYILVCGILPFQFFRDGFFILNKQLFFNFLIIPGLVLLAMKLIIYFQNPERNLLRTENKSL